MQQTTLTVVPVQSLPQQTPRLNIPVIRGLGITQIVFGILCIIFGIVLSATLSKYVWVNVTGSGIWFGIWILITGIIGIFSARKPEVRALNGVNMGFNITCTVVCFFVGIFFAVALAHYNSCREYSWYYYRCQHKTGGIALYAILLLLMIAEFFVSLVISIYCCQGTGCCAAQSAGVIIQQQPVVSTSGGQMIVTSNAAYPTQTAYQPQASYPLQTVYPPQMMMSNYPPGSVAPVPSYQQSMYQQGQTPQQGVVMQAPMGAGTTTTTYSGDQVQEYEKNAPPPYSTAP